MPTIDDTLDTSAAEAFRLLWEALADLLGQAAAALLLRRAANVAQRDNPELQDLVIARGNLEYRYTLPRTWSERGTFSLVGLVLALRPLLEELTGTMAIGRLQRIPALRDLITGASCATA